jgi:hypothetical protein
MCSQVGFFFWLGSLVLLIRLSWGYHRAPVLMGPGQVKELGQMKGWVIFFFFLTDSGWAVFVGLGIFFMKLGWAVLFVG